MNIINAFCLSNILVIISSLFMGIFILVRGWTRPENKLFGLLCFLTALWGLGAYKLSIDSSMSWESGFFWCQVAYTGVISVPVLYFHFITSYLKLNRKRLLLCVYALGSVFLICNIFARRLFLGDIRLIFGQFYFVDWVKHRNPLFLFFYISFYWALLGYTFVLLLSSYRNSSGHRRTQLKYIILASAFGWIGAECIFLPTLGIDLYPFSNFLVALYPIIMGYAIVRHQLMEIEVVVKKTLVYSIIISVITILYFIIVYILEKVFSVILGYHSIPIAVGIIAFFSIIFIPLKNRVQRIIDKGFFHGTIDQIDEENIKLREELQKSEKLKTIATIAASMAHEIKNPLTSIKTFTEHLNKKKDDPDFIRKFQEIVGGEVDRINYTVKQLLEFSKPSELQIKETDINTLLDDTLALLNSDLLEHNIKVKKDYSTLPRIKVDPSQMKQVFLNIFLNAIDAMRRNGTIFVSTRPSAANAKNPDSVTISIRDTGKGIDRQDLKHIFDPFFSKKDSGTGLGLSVVHGIIEKHGGKVKVGSKPGEGTSFSLILPLQ